MPGIFHNLFFLIISRTWGKKTEGQSLSFLHRSRRKFQSGEECDKSFLGNRCKVTKTQASVWKCALSFPHHCNSSCITEVHKAKGSFLSSRSLWDFVTGWLLLKSITTRSVCIEVPHRFFLSFLQDCVHLKQCGFVSKTEGTSGLWGATRRLVFIGWKRGLNDRIKTGWLSAPYVALTARSRKIWNSTEIRI